MCNIPVRAGLVRRRVLPAVVAFAAAWCVAAAAEESSPRVQESDPMRELKLYTVATAHLDTQWLWTIQTTIDEYVPSTLHQNFALFEEFPNYVFSFEGAFRYMLAKEYYPRDYARLKGYIAQGRWHVCGSSVDSGDVNVPSPESLIRNILYGNRFFRQEFGKTSVDIFLPDCFGFGYVLPTVAAHCGLKGFSTQKLSWGSSVGIPFDIGVWQGVDGSRILAALNPGSYSADVKVDLRQDAKWAERIKAVGEKCGAYVGYMYYGVGDIGGAPSVGSVRLVEQAIANSGGLVRVASMPADQLFRDLTPEHASKLPVYDGELLMTKHGVGCYTSQSILKRWNRRNEQLGDAAERAAVVADWLGGAAYPKSKLADAWVRLLWHHFHDDLTGTSIPQAYPFSWNDEIVVANQFAETLTDAVGAVARALDTRAEGVPLVVYNPLAIEREDVVEARVPFPGARPVGVQVFDPQGRPVPAQLGAVFGDAVEVIFLAKAPPVGFAVYDVRPAPPDTSLQTSLEVGSRRLANERYIVELNDDGDIAQIIDRRHDRSLLDRPVRLQLLEDTPQNWPEWEIDFEDIQAAPKGYVGGTPQIRVLEEGPARVALEVVRTVGKSRFVQRIRLASGGAADRVEVHTQIDWRDTRTLVKAAFPLSVASEKAVYDLGIGTVARGINTEKLYEVPAQQWVDLSQPDGAYGVSLLSDCRYGWDKPDERTMRLTLLHSPHAITKDQGRHELAYAIVGHDGDWRRGDAVNQAPRLNQPMPVFQTTPHDGPLGRSFGLVRIEPENVAVMALKQAEDGDELVIRVRETHGKAVEAGRLRLAAPIAAGREVTGGEDTLGEARVVEGALEFSLRAHQPRAFAIRLSDPPARLQPPVSNPVELQYDVAVASRDGEACEEGFDGTGRCLPAELLPDRIVSEGVEFRLGQPGADSPNAVISRGQSLELPDGDFTHVAVLAAASHDERGAFVVGDVEHACTVQGFTGYVGQWKRIAEDGSTIGGGFIKRDPIAWVGTHRHDRNGRNEPYVFCYLYRYVFPLPAGARTLRLPDNERIRVLAVSVVKQGNFATTPAGLLYDELESPVIDPPGGLMIAPVEVRVSGAADDGQIRYTLDGAEPGADSPVYDRPVRIEKTTTMKAAIFRAGQAAREVTRVEFRFATPRPGHDVAAPTAGLAYSYYEGSWERLPNFSTLEPIGRGSAEALTPDVRKRDVNFGLRFEGYVRVPAEGVYTFYLASDDGSRLAIGDEVVIDNDGLHGMVERNGQVALAAGLHPIRLDYFQRGGGLGLSLKYSGPGIPKQEVPAGALYRP